MTPYRLYFRSETGKIQGRDDFEAEDGRAAALLAQLLGDACSDVCATVELWQAETRVELPAGRAPRPPESAIEVAARTQAALIRREEAIRDSQWAIARSERLLQRLRAVRSSAAAKMDDSILAIARSLICQHGDGALAVAEKAAANVRTLNMSSMVRHWENVAAAVRMLASRRDLVAHDGAQDVAE